MHHSPHPGVSGLVSVAKGCFLTGFVLPGHAQPSGGSLWQGLQWGLDLGGAQEGFTVLPQGLGSFVMGREAAGDETK